MLCHKFKFYLIGVYPQFVGDIFFPKKQKMEKTKNSATGGTITAEVKNKPLILKFFNRENKPFKFIRRSFVVFFGIDCYQHIVHEMLAKGFKITGMVVYSVFFVLIALDIFFPKLFASIEHKNKVFKTMRWTNIIISLCFAIFDLTFLGKLEAETIVMIVLEIGIELIHHFLVG